MAGRSALIVGNGEPPSRELFAACAREADLVLCADGGADTARRLGRAPDYIAGDLDSVSGPGMAAVAGDRLVRVDADDTGTDMQKVLRLALELGVGRADMLGFTGRRTDHTLWNLSLLRTFGDRLDLRLIDDHCEIRLIRGRVRFRADVGQKLSLCPLDGPAGGIETEGLRWPLRGESLVPGRRDGISNEVTASPVEIRVGRGDLLLCVQRQSASGRIELLE
ncbi:MAG: thiamine diphosphokinase [Gemmatimonadaceae bacterium]|nr:thiamine diphosphokinase [Gemmatimonadaceae bacterium]